MDDAGILDKIYPVVHICVASGTFCRYDVLVPENQKKFKNVIR